MQLSVTLMACQRAEDSYIAGKLQVLELRGFRHIPGLWTEATMLTCLKFSGCGSMHWPELHALPRLKCLTFSA